MRNNKARLERLEGRRAAAVRRLRTFLERPRGSGLFVEAGTGKPFTRAEIGALPDDGATLLILEYIKGREGERHDDAGE